MKKAFFTCIAFLFVGFSTIISAQNYLAYNSENIRTTVDGASANFLNVKISPSKRLETRQALNFGLYQAADNRGSQFYSLTYHFAYPITKMGNGGLFVAINPGLGTNGTSSVREGSSVSYGFDLPIMAEIHLGRAEKWGSVLGLGCAYNYMGDSEGVTSRKTFGPAASAGIRVPIAGKTCLLKVSYQLNVLPKTENADAQGGILGVTFGFAF